MSEDAALAGIAGRGYLAPIPGGYIAGLAGVFFAPVGEAERVFEIMAANRPVPFRGVVYGDETKDNLTIPVFISAARHIGGQIRVEITAATLAMANPIP